MATPQPPGNWKDALSILGLGTPVARGFVATVAATAVLYAAGQPRAAFTEDGAIRPFKLLSPGPDGVNCHFLVAPLAVGSAVFLFT